MEFHISRAVREKLNVDDLLFSYTGNVVFGNVAASRKLASQLNEARGPQASPENTVNAGALFAMGMIDELNHALVARYRAADLDAVRRRAGRDLRRAKIRADAHNHAPVPAGNHPRPAVTREPAAE